MVVLGRSGAAREPTSLTFRSPVGLAVAPINKSGTHVSMVCHIFTAVDGVITGVRGYRNERGIPGG